MQSGGVKMKDLANLNFPKPLSRLESNPLEERTPEEQIYSRAVGPIDLKK